MKSHAGRDCITETKILIVGVLEADGAGSKGMMVQVQRSPNLVGTSLLDPQGRLLGQ